MKAVRALPVFLFLMCLACPGPAAADPVTAIVGATVIDGTGGAPLKDATIVIDGRKIAAVGPRGRVTIPAGAREINVAGKYVIPGLMDANVHLVLGSSIEFIVRYEGRYEDLIEEAAQVTLKNGVTTVFDSWGPLQPLINVRDRINRGEIAGSRTFIAGNIVGFSGPFGRDFNAAAETTATKPLVRRINRIWEENTGPDLMWDTPEQVHREIKRYISRGIDFLKYGASGHREEDFLQFSPEAQQAIVEECHKAGIIAQTHTTSVESLRQALDAGVDMLQHGSVTGPTPIPEATIKLMLDKKVYCAVQPRTAKRQAIELEQAEDAVPSRRAKERLQTWHDNEVRLIKAHVPLLLATDAGMMDPDAAESMKPKLRIERPTELGEAHVLWFKAMAEKGMTPMDAIVSSTRNIAAAYHKLDQIGTLQAGKLADLIVLDANPLQDVHNIRKISIVMKDGQVVDRDTLPQKKVLSIPRSTAPRPTSSSNGGTR
jgi:imidazolonepropionase-like amidohydrolase